MFLPPHMVNTVPCFCHHTWWIQYHVSVITHGEYGTMFLPPHMVNTVPCFCHHTWWIQYHVSASTHGEYSTMFLSSHMVNTVPCFCLHTWWIQYHISAYHQGLKIALVRLYLWVPQAAGRVKNFDISSENYFFPYMPIFLRCRASAFFKIFRVLYHTWWIWYHISASTHGWYSTIFLPITHGEYGTIFLHIIHGVYGTMFLPSHRFCATINRNQWLVAVTSSLQLNWRYT